MRRLPLGDGGLAVHVLADVGGATQNSYVEETEILAFDCFWDGPHYHYGPRNKNHRIYWDRTLVEDPLGWVFEQFENRKLPAMIERAGYPGIAADLDLERIAAILPVVKKKAREMQTEGEALTGHPGLPLTRPLIEPLRRAGAGRRDRQLQRGHATATGKSRAWKLAALSPHL
jgi:hypothetical protein